MFGRATITLGIGPHSSWRLFCILYLQRAARTAQHVSDLHSKFALRPHHVWKYGRHSISDRWG